MKYVAKNIILITLWLGQALPVISGEGEKSVGVIYDISGWLSQITNNYWKKNVIRCLNNFSRGFRDGLRQWIKEELNICSIIIPARFLQRNAQGNLYNTDYG